VTILTHAEVAKLADLPAGRQARKVGQKNNMYSVYVLVSQNRNYIYVGLTDNVKRRVGQHQAGKEKTTKVFRPYNLVLIETYASRAEARAREKFLKGGSGKEWIKRSILGRI